MILTLTKADSRKQPNSHKVEMHVEKHGARSFVTLINEGQDKGEGLKFQLVN